MVILICFQIFVLLFVVGVEGEPFKIIAKPFPFLMNRNFRAVHPKDNVNISCQTNLPTATVYLLFSTYTYNETVAHYGKRLIKFNQTFMLKDIRLTDGGALTCYAINGNVNKTLELGYILVRGAPCKETPRLEYYGNVISSIIAEKDDELKIYCIALGSYNKRRKSPLKWVRLGNEEMLTTYFKKENMYDVLILSINKVQQSSAGTYRCMRKVEKCAENTETYTDFVLKITEPQAPIVYVQPVKIEVGLNVSIDCNVKASPAPDIQWKNKHGKVIKECFKERHCTFEIKRVEATHSGNYTCIASNSEGIQRSQSEVSVLIAPQIIKALYHTNRMLSCQVSEGIPIPNLYWQKCIARPHGKSCNFWIDMNEGSADVKVQNMVIDQKHAYSEIEFHSSDDFGYYRCVAVNIVGNASDSIYLPKVASVPTSLKGSTWIGLICGFLVLIFLFIIFIICYRKYMIHKYAPFMTPNKGFKFDHNRTIFEQSIELPYDIEWEFPRKRLDWKMKIGSGAFGEVWMANAFGIAALAPRDKGMRAVRRRTILRCNQPVIKEVVKCVFRDNACNNCSLVAVKTLKENSTDEEYRDLASEIKILIHLGNHKNIVNILGACTYGGKLVSIMEFCPHGNLLNFLQSRRNLYSYDWNRKLESYDEYFCLFDVAYGALQIARGMQFLSSKKFVHRDLAARNVLVADNYVLKVADFGLARDVYKTDVYYKKGSGILPVKWMAPESIFDKKYDVKSDVWSFGVVLWEICTMGGTPYCGIQTADIFEYLQQGHRMERPEHCPGELYQIMELCWQEDPVRRPMFHELESQIENIIRNKCLISNNLAAFERLRSFSDETDYMIPTSPSRLKRNSLDAILDFRKELISTKIPRKRSVDALFNFHPIYDMLQYTNNNNGVKYENHYVDPPKHNGRESFF